MAEALEEWALEWEALRARGLGGWGSLAREGARSHRGPSASPRARRLELALGRHRPLRLLSLLPPSSFVPSLAIHYSNPPLTDTARPGTIAQPKSQSTPPSPSLSLPPSLPLLLAWASPRAPDWWLTDWFLCERLAVTVGLVGLILLLLVLLVAKQLPALLGGGEERLKPTAG